MPSKEKGEQAKKAIAARFKRRAKKGNRRPSRTALQEVRALTSGLSLHNVKAHDREARK